MAINFELRSVSTRKNATSFLYCKVREGNVNMRFRSDIEVTTNDYHKAFRKGASRAALNAYNSTAEGAKVLAQKETVKAQVIAAIADGLTTADEIGGRVHVALVLDDARKKAAEAARLQTSCVLPYMDRFIDKATKGEIKTSRRKNFDPATLTYYKNLRRHFSEYLGSEQNITFNEINCDIADGFIKYMEDKNIMKSTQKNILSCMGAICKRAWNAGLIDPIKVGVCDLWKMPTPKDDEMKAEIALTESEVDAIWELAESRTLDSTDQLTLDVFLAGVYSMQRFSDYSRFSKDMVVEIEGRKFLHVKQDKTENYVDIPLVGRLNEVLVRNDYNFTKLDVKTRKWVGKLDYFTFSRRLRKILHELSKDVPSLKEMTVTPLTAKEIKMESRFAELLHDKNNDHIKVASAAYNTLLRDMKIQNANGCMGTEYLWKRNAHGEVIKEKWALASSHLARRTGITLALDAGILSDDQIRKISGHKTLKAFRRYDKRDEKKQNANIYDALERAANNSKTKVVTMAVNQ